MTILLFFKQFLIKAPGITKPGAICNTPVVSTDFSPTILDVCGLPLMPKQHVDGVSVLPLLKGKSIKRKTIYWHYPHYGGKGDSPAAAVREGNWKLIEFYETGKIELYNLKCDISEKNNLAQKESKRAKKMLEKLHNWQKSVNAQMPVKNSNYK